NECVPTTVCKKVKTCVPEEVCVRKLRLERCQVAECPKPACKTDSSCECPRESWFHRLCHRRLNCDSGCGGCNNGYGSEAIAAPLGAGAPAPAPAPAAKPLPQPTK